MIVGLIMVNSNLKARKWAILILILKMMDIVDLIIVHSNLKARKWAILILKMTETTYPLKLLRLDDYILREIIKFNRLLLIRYLINVIMMK